MRISPRRRSGNLSRPLLTVNNFFPFFQKTFYPAVPGLPALPGSTGRFVPQRRERVMHLCATPVNDFLFFS